MLANHPELTAPGYWLSAKTKSGSAKPARTPFLALTPLCQSNNLDSHPSCNWAGRGASR